MDFSFAWSRVVPAAYAYPKGVTGSMYWARAGVVCLAARRFCLRLRHSGLSGVVTGSRKLLPVTLWQVASGFRRETRESFSLVTAK